MKEDELKKSLSKAQKEQHAYQQQLVKLAKLLAENTDDDDQGGTDIGDHVLQLRQDHQDLIKTMLKVNRSLCIALGIAPQQHGEANLERAAYALGKQDFSKKLRRLAHLLSLIADTTELTEKNFEREKNHKKILKQLSDKAEKQVSQSKQDKSSKEQSKQTQQEKQKQAESKKENLAAYTEDLGKELRTAEDIQYRFQHSLEQLTQALQRYGGIPEFGMLYNHISGFKQPYSQFYLTTPAGTPTPEPIDSEQLKNQVKAARLTQFYPHP